MTSDQANLDLDDFRQRLEARRRDLLGRAASTADDRKPVELDQTSVGRLSRMDALQVQAMAVETARRRDGELARVEQAILRLDSGDFGYCLVCDEEIPARRLELDPATPTCVKCASGAERP